MSPLPKPRGRRAKSATTRDDIVVAARELFSEVGFDAASLRSIAARAGVDAALIHHYFGSKAELFQVALQIPVDPRELLAQNMPADPQQWGAHVIATVLGLWDSPHGKAGLALLRSAVNSTVVARLLREFLVARGVGPMVALTEPDLTLRDWRISLVATQLGGMIMARYVLQFEPFASANPAFIVAALGPTVQGYLTGELPSIIIGGAPGEAELPPRFIAGDGGSIGEVQ